MDLDYILSAKKLAAPTWVIVGVVRRERLKRRVDGLQQQPSWSVHCLESFALV